MAHLPKLPAPVSNSDHKQVLFVITRRVTPAAKQKIDELVQDSIANIANETETSDLVAVRHYVDDNPWQQRREREHKDGRAQVKY